uniref:Uncharacterized protein n=1 Tax=Rhizophora mucronata TaxID=61149 RepID=A0A2P2PAP4_RHIMU
MKPHVQPEKLKC